ncbi:hypothetical protein Tco_0774384 [Tanacetum coccineum]|uniref:Uncharacterized protein n=1 Tax=Tanacetum coccineum TaxID=301880 RepID=A0ABQ4ZSM4_9ASTR
MFINVDQLKKQLEKEEIQEKVSMAAFRVLKTQFQQFIDSRFSLDYDGQMTSKYFLKYTRIEEQFHDTLIQHMEFVKKSIDERAKESMTVGLMKDRYRQKMEMLIRVVKALDASMVVTESRGTISGKQDTSSRSGNDTEYDDANIRPSYDEEPMATVQSTTEHNVSANEQQHAEQHEFNNEGGVD